jgi:Fe-S-cluster containining protein
MDERVPRVMAEFDAVDRAIEAFVAASKLSCPPECGACCNSPEVEATTVELLPMAEALVAEERADEVLAALDAALARGVSGAGLGEPVPSRCVMYRPDPADAARGRCGAYAVRPLICRMFGFGTRRERTGRTELVACRVMRASDPARMQHAERDDAALSLAPVMSDHAHALGVESPGDEARLRPINVALHEALQRVVLARRLRGLADED